MRARVRSRVRVRSRDLIRRTNDPRPRVRPARLPCTLLQRHASQQRCLPINYHQLVSSVGKIYREGESFKDWIDQLEMVASISNWDERTKLVNLTRLRGQACAFYKSCSVQQRRNYTTLVAELTKRFTPVRLKAVQSGLFHERKQKVPSESVNTYAQDLQ